MKTYPENSFMDVLYVFKKKINMCCSIYFWQLAFCIYKMP